MREILANDLIPLSMLVSQSISVNSEALVSLLNFLIMACRDSASFLSLSDL